MIADRVTFDELLRRLAKSRIGHQLAGLATLDASVFVPSGEEPRFVAPNFLLTDPPSIDHPQVLLISAPAAVGKTTLARVLAFRTGNLIWDLSEFSVGSGFFSGVLLDTFGTDGVQIVQRAIAENTTTLEAYSEVVF